MTAIRLENLCKRYDSAAAHQAAVEDVNLDIAQGEFFFLLGPSGCGKTTLLRIVAGLIEPTAGRVLFGQRDVTSLPAEQRSAAMVFQNYALWPHMTVLKNVQFGPKMKGLPGDQRVAVANANLHLVQMADYATRKPNQLSGGQQQRVALARALAAQSHCLLLDEPLSNLDARLRHHMRGELRQLVKASGATAIYVTHDQAEALAMADRIAVMNAGRIIQVAAPQDLYENPVNSFVADFLGESNSFVATVRSRDARGVHLHAPDGGVLSSSRQAPAGTDKPLCCVRPEKILLAAGGSGASTGAAAEHSRLRAVVESVMYLGHLRQYTCRLSPGAVWKVLELGTAAGLPVGAPVDLLIHPQDVMLLRE